MTDFSYELKIPKARVAVLIGEKGKTKQEIEKRSKAKLKIDSEEGDVFIRGDDSLGLYEAKEVIGAIGRGFNPDVAISLFGGDYVCEFIDLKEATKSKKSLIRIKGRIIGQEGKSRRIIEELSDTEICIYGKTVGIIGDSEHVTLARRAIEKLLEGSPHSKVYRWLERARRQLKRQL